MNLLTILVPTWNRAGNLALLLRTLKSELAGLEADVDVLVSDNGSTDSTPELVREIQADWPALRVQRHVENIGADANFCSCVDAASARYFWMIGDDDLPKRGVIARVVALLKESEPALVYLGSEWVNPVLGPDQGEPVGALRVDLMEATAFARRVHVWFTFISGVIVDRTLLAGRPGGVDIRRFTGTSLVQLGWVLPLLKVGRRFAFVHDRCVLATKDNTGGYPLMTVFGVRFSRIAGEVFGRDSRIANLLVRGAILFYLPGLLWGMRTAASTRHQDEDAWPQMRVELGDRALYWLLLVPLGRFPRWLAQPFYQAWRVFNRLSSELRARRDGAAARTEGSR